VPGALQDAAAVYAHLVTHHVGAFKGPDGKYHYPYPNLPVPSHTHIDNSSVPHLVSDTLPPSISRVGSAVPLVSSPTGAEYQQHVEATGGYVERDDLVEPQISGNDASPHSLVNPVHSTPATSDPIAAARRPRIILIGDSAGGNVVLALARWIRDEGVLPPPDGMLLLSPSCDPCKHCIMVSKVLLTCNM
jgi:alpha/beta hydrolase fold